jgi:hypothetical protein
VQLLAVIMDRLGQLLSDSFCCPCTCEIVLSLPYASILMVLGVECPVINQLWLDFGTFTCNSFYLLYVNRIDCSAKK